MFHGYPQGLEPFPVRVGAWLGVFPRRRVESWFSDFHTAPGGSPLQDILNAHNLYGLYI